SSAPPAFGRDASERISRSVPCRRPVAGSRRMSLSPDQNEPYDIHHRPSPSTRRFGAIALWSDEVVDSTTRPRLVQEPDAPVGDVARKIADRWEPNDDAE